MTAENDAQLDDNPHAKKAKHLMDVGPMRAPTDDVIVARAQVHATLAMAEELSEVKSALFEMNRLTGELLT